MGPHLELSLNLITEEIAGKSVMGILIRHVISPSISDQADITKNADLYTSTSLSLLLLRTQAVASQRTQATLENLKEKMTAHQALGCIVKKCPIAS